MSIRSLMRTQGWLLRFTLLAWIAGAVVNVLDSNWSAAIASVGAAWMTLTAISATETRDRLFWEIAGRES